MKLSGKILYTFMISSALLMLNACDMIYEYYPEAELQDDSALLILHINKMAGNATSVDDESESVTEAIESLRIIIIDDKSEIEYNKLINSSDLSQENESGLIYTLTYHTTPGTKKFYLFANEESVKLSDNQTLTQFFNDITTSKKNFEESINSLSFTPEPNYGLTDNTVKLPYSSYYELEMEHGKNYNKPMFLVPVATKFTVNITNNRKEAIEIKSLTIDRLANQTYMLAHVGTQDYNKNGQYWIDWLADVSAESHSYKNYEDNVGFNAEKGWIFDYALPENVSYSSQNLLPSESYIVTKPQLDDAQNVLTPFKDTLPTIYFPESRYFDGNTNEGTVQTYSLTLTVADTNEGTDSDSETEKIITMNRLLPNVKALFRNTHVIINIEMGMGYMDVYAEIYPWSIDDDPLKGFVEKEDEL